jgi:cysteine desulfuration protein SufE
MTTVGEGMRDERPFGRFSLHYRNVPMKETQSIQETIEEIKEEFAFMGDWRERFQYVIDLGKEMPKLPEDYYTDEYKVEGCVSQVWLEAHLEGDRVKYRGDSDAAIVRGLVGLMVRVYSDHTPEEILEVPPEFLLEMGITTHLTPNRSNGLAALAKKMMTYAGAFKEIRSREAGA